ncbi:hypothetical protein K445DRAFT_186279 [Daldinia sp. EC12]|nr:hypothetical protein K445DRAFT_186279 [Daldinia sp. EC12]
MDQFGLGRFYIYRHSSLGKEFLILHFQAGLVRLGRRKKRLSGGGLILDWGGGFFFKKPSFFTLLFFLHYNYIGVVLHKRSRAEHRAQSIRLPRSSISHHTNPYQRLYTYLPIIAASVLSRARE